MQDRHAPWLDQAYSALIDDLRQRGLLGSTLVVALGEFGRSPRINDQAGRDHWPDCYTALVAGGGLKRGFVYGKSDKTASAPVENPVHPKELLATIYHSVGIDPATIVYNHLNQPRELVQAESITSILA